MNIYIVRHGKSKQTDGMAFAESSQVDLSDLGLVQVKALGHRMASFNLDLVISSPLPRTRQTAEAIARNKIPLEFDDRLIEHVPSKTLVGKEFKQAKAQCRQDHDFIPLNGESFNSAANRFISALNDVVKLPHSNVCIVAHALIIESAFSNLFNLKEIPEIHEASVSLVEYSDGCFTLKYVNRTPLTLKKSIKRAISYFKELFKGFN